MTQYANIIGTGRYVPKNEITNETLAKWMKEANPALEAVVEKFEASSNIKTRFYGMSVFHVQDVVDVHMKAFPGFTLSILGARFP